MMHVRARCGRYEARAFECTHRWSLALRKCNGKRKVVYRDLDPLRRDPCVETRQGPRACPVLAGVRGRGVRPLFY